MVENRYTKLLENQDQIIDAFRELLEGLEIYEKEQMYTETVTGMQKYLDQWFAFCDDLSDWNERVEGEDKAEKIQKPEMAAEPEFEQLTLPFVEPVPENGNPAQKEKSEFQGFRMIPSKSQHTPAELMCRLRKSEGADFCKYLCLNVTGKMKKTEYFQMVEDFLQEHPIYCLYLISEEGLHWITQFRKDGVVADEQIGKIQRTVAYAMIMGLVEVYYSEEDGWNTASIAYTDAAEAVLKLDGEETAKKYHRQVEQWDKVSAAVLQLYGVMEIPALYEKCCELADFQTDLTEYQRYLYWHCRMQGFIRTGTDKETGVPIVSTTDVDLFGAISLQHKYLRDIPYKPFSSNDLRNYLEQGITAICPYWTDLEDYLRAKSVPDSKIEDWITVWICGVTDGENASELMAEIRDMLEDYAVLSVMDRIAIWELSVILAMRQGIAGLKGYSRKEFRERFGPIPDELSVIDVYSGRKLKNGYQIRTHLEDMPAEIQMKLYDALTMKEKEAAAVLAGIRKQYGENVELLCLEANLYSRMEDMEHTQVLLKRAVSLADSRDASDIENLISDIRALQQIENTQDEFYEDDWLYEKEEPYRRSAPKIGRNDPCPCGSGKKYKKCCGRDS